MDRYSHIVRAISDATWALKASTLATIVDLLAFRAAGGVLTAEEISARIEAADRGPRRGRQRAGVVGVVPIYGVIAPRVEAMNSSGGTSVDAIGASFREALADPEISAILLDIDSPGGVVDGIPELAAEIRAGRETKPILALANTLSASAAYWLGSSADELSATESAKVGSIGVFTVHEDLSAKLESEGIRPTLISAGKYKTEGSPFGPLTDEARAERQASVNEVYAMMTAGIGKSRGVSAATVREDYGEGRTLSAKRALEAGMIDRVETFDQAVKRLAAGKIRSRAERGQIAALYGAPEYMIGERGPERIYAVRGGQGFPVVLGPIRPHGGATSDDAWDGPANEANLPSEAGPLRASHAWFDDEGDPDAKATYKFVHHFVSEGGEVGAASTRGCSAGIAVLNGGRGGADIPDGDRAGVHAHLARHLRDAGQEPPELAVAPPVSLVSGIPYAERLALVVAEAEFVLAHTRERRAMRSSEGRDLSEATRSQIRALSVALAGLAEPLEIAPPATNARATALRVARLRAELEAVS